PASALRSAAARSHLVRMEEESPNVAMAARYARRRIRRAGVPLHGRASARSRASLPFGEDHPRSRAPALRAVRRVERAGELLARWRSADRFAFVRRKAEPKFDRSLARA